jgi:hypothetical protein
MNDLSARVVGVVSVDGNDANAITDVTHAVSNTQAVVPPSAWGPVGVRPASCGIGQCCTGLNDAGETAVGGECPLVFKINGNGSGLGSAIATAIKVLTNYVTLDVGAWTEDDPSDSIDAVAEFVDRLEAVTAGTAPCAPGLIAVDTDTDAILDTFDDVLPGTTVCFKLIPKMNTTVPPHAGPQVFKAKVNVIGDATANLDSREVYFIVPPDANEVTVQ